ncbi:MAG: WecB/TagA/CpsF family glycosyltransferase, partial [Erysipelotrichaceae bacterium]|nr:WecB/TagA/CpsF family glycosyltransferase [Erysipelotrichaceae bacterium]
SQARNKYTFYPKQELAIYRNLKKVDKGLFIGVGGSLDVLSGVKKRAPKFIIRCKLEWLFRLLKEPRRIKKFYQTHITFLFKIRKLKR